MGFQKRLTPFMMPRVRDVAFRRTDASSSARCEIEVAAAPATGFIGERAPSGRRGRDLEKDEQSIGPRPMMPGEVCRFGVILGLLGRSNKSYLGFQSYTIMLSSNLYLYLFLN
jgi:hypothetical protein